MPVQQQIGPIHLRCFTGERWSRRLASEAELHQAEENIQILLECVHIENNILAFVESLIEYVGTQHDVTMSHSLVPREHELFYSLAHARLLNRRLLEVLSLGRRYVHHLCDGDTLKQVFPGLSEFAHKIDESKKRDVANKEYYLAGLLRNHMQHRSLAVSGLRTRHWKEGEGESLRFKSMSMPMISVKHIQRELKPKERDVIDGAGGIDGIEDVGRIVRGYAASLVSMHQQIRDFTDESMRQAKVYLRELIEGEAVRASMDSDNAGLFFTIVDNQAGSEEIVLEIPRHAITMCDQFRSQSYAMVAKLEVWDPDLRGEA